MSMFILDLLWFFWHICAIRCDGCDGRGCQACGDTGRQEGG